MKIVFTSYIKTNSFAAPELWLQRIRGYIGILEALSKYFEVVSIEQINYEGELNKNGVKYFFKKFNEKKPASPVHQHEFIKTLNADIIIVHGMHFPRQVMQLRKAVGKSVKIIEQNHAELPFRWPMNYLQKMADKSIDAYMFTSVEMAENWVHKKLITKEKVWGIMEASSAFSPIDKVTAKNKTNVTGDPAFLFVGRLDKNKDPLKVVSSFLKYNKQKPSSRLYMLYHTTELLDDIQNILNKEDSKQVIALIGKRDHNEMFYWYSASDFIISASHYEGSGVAVCEGMSCGCIPILTSITSFKKLTANGGCGILYDVDTKDALFEALLKTQTLNIEEEKKKVLQQFHDDLSFKAIAKQINDKIQLLF
jgi:glycosyltransferase involved in cell wall biosynthesis